MIFENTHKLIEELKTRFDNQESRIKYLEKQNKKIQEENWAEEKYQRMQSKYEAMKRDYYRGFPISEEEKRKIREWQEKHDIEKHKADTLEKRLKLEGVSGGRFKYIFVPTAIGTSGCIQCSCGEKFYFQNL